MPPCWTDGRLRFLRVTAPNDRRWGRSARGGQRAGAAAHPGGRASTRGTQRPVESHAACWLRSRSRRRWCLVRLATSAPRRRVERVQWPSRLRVAGLLAPLGLAAFVVGVCRRRWLLRVLRGLLSEQGIPQPGADYVLLAALERHQGVVRLEMFDAGGKRGLQLALVVTHYVSLQAHPASALVPCHRAPLSLERALYHHETWPPRGNSMHSLMLAGRSRATQRLAQRWESPASRRCWGRGSRRSPLHRTGYLSPLQHRTARRESRRWACGAW